VSWPGWLTYSGRFTHTSGHLSAAGRAQDSESLPVRDRRFLPLCHARHSPHCHFPALQRAWVHWTRKLAAEQSRSKSRGLFSVDSVVADGVTSQNFRHWSSPGLSEARTHWVLKLFYSEPSDWSAANQKDWRLLTDATITWCGMFFCPFLWVLLLMLTILFCLLLPLQPWTRCLVFVTRMRRNLVLNLMQRNLNGWPSYPENAVG